MRSLEDRRERPQREILQGQTRTNQVQFKDKQTPEIKECTRKDQRESEWVKLPEHPHYAICPPSVCMRVGCVDIPTDDILKEWIQQGIVQQRHRFNSGHAVQRASQNSNDIAISDEDFFNFDTPNHKGQSMSHQFSAKNSLSSVMT